MRENPDIQVTRFLEANKANAGLYRWCTLFSYTKANKISEGYLSYPPHEKKHHHHLAASSI